MDVQPSTCLGLFHALVRKNWLKDYLFSQASKLIIFQKTHPTLSTALGHPLVQFSELV